MKASSAEDARPVIRLHAINSPGIGYGEGAPAGFRPRSGHRKIETVANVVIIFSGLLFGIRLLKPDLFTSPRATGPPVGTKLTTVDWNWVSHGQTLVLVLQVGCRFAHILLPSADETSERRAW